MLSNAVSFGEAVAIMIPMGRADFGQTGAQVGLQNGAIGVVVAEGLTLFREGLVALLSGAQGGGPVVRSAGSLDEAMLHLSHGVAAGASAGVLLLDLALPGTDAAAVAGTAGLALVRARFPAVRIVALAGCGTRDEALRCLAAGAHGYVAKSASAAELIRAIEAVRDGGVHVPASLVMAPEAEQEPQPQSGADPGEDVPDRTTIPGPASMRMLTGRQRDVLRLMAEGRSTKDIARTLDLAVSTIKVHLAGVYRAVGARNRVEALCRAGLLPGEALLS